MGYTMNMAWEPIQGFEGYYSVSDEGEIRSEARIIVRSNGRPHTVKEKLLSPHRDTSGYLFTRIYHPDKKRKNIWIHREVYKAFKGTIPPDYDIDHINGGILDNHIANLQAVDRATHAALTSQRIRKESYDEGYEEGYTAGWKAAMKAIPK